MAFVYNGWTLYRREVEIEEKGRQTVYFFSKRIPHEGIQCDLPNGYKVVEGERTGLPRLMEE